VTVNAHSNDTAASRGRDAGRRATGDASARVRGRRRTARRETDGWGRIQALVDVVPEAVYVAKGNRLELRNAAAERLFPDDPIRDRADLVARFEPVAVDRPDGLPETDPMAGDDAVIVRQRNRPNRWFALRTVTLDRLGGDDARDDADPPVAFVLRDVTDTPDLRPLRDAFLGLVSHELRTPITTIYAGSTVLARSPRLSVPATRTLAHDVSAEAARLYDVVEDLLALGRIERAVLDPLDEPVDIGQVLDTTIRVVSGRLPGTRILRGGRTGAIVARGDATYLDQAFRNLVLAVARRPGQPANATIDVDVAIDHERSELTATIHDDGPPVSRAELQSLFEIVELGAPANPLGGLTLYVARQLIEAMGGRVWARSRTAERGLELGVALRLA
jgi:signal transduction histidine kinase